MKRMAWMLLGLALAAMLCTGALAQDEGAIVQSSCNIVQSGEYYLVYCFAQVHNNSDQVICLDEGGFQLMSGEQMLAADGISRLWPYFLAPGVAGYLFNIVSFEPGENGAAAPAVTGLNYNIEYMTVDPAHGGQALETQTHIEVNDTTGRMTVVCEIVNPTDEDAYNPTVGFGLYTDGGQMVYAGGMSLNNIGIPAGGKVMVRFDVEQELTEQWQSYDAMPAQVRANAIFSNTAD